MKIKEIFFCAVLLMVTLASRVYAVEPEITAASGFVIDCIDGKTLYEKNSKEKMYPASLTKILTAAIVMENCNINDEVIVSQQAIDNVEAGYLTANIKAGEKLTVGELLNLLLITSCNDVANVLAEHVAGSNEAFVEMMNNKAKELGCKDSNFTNCNGTHDTNHYSTAYDLGLIGRYAVQFDEIKEIICKKEYTLRATNIYDREDRIYYTTNEMLLNWSSNYYKYAKGIKTGFTTPSGNCIMVYAEKDELPLISVIMKSTTSDSRYDDSKKILEYSWDNNSIKTIVEEGTSVQTITVSGATKDSKKLNVVLEEPIKAVVNNKNLSENPEPKIVVYEKLKAPIEQGTVIGNVTYEIEGKQYEANLIAGEKVFKSKTGMIFFLIFIILIVFVGTLRIIEIKNRNKMLSKIRQKIKK